MSQLRFLSCGIWPVIHRAATMRKNAIAVQELSSGFSAADDRGYNGKVGREFAVDEANDLPEY